MTGGGAPPLLRGDYGQDTGARRGLDLTDADPSALLNEPIS